MEPLDEHPGEARERSPGRRSHRGGDRQELRAPREALGARAAAVLARIDEDPRPQQGPQALAPPALGLDHRRGERRQRCRTGRRRHRPVAPEADPVEDALSEPSEPAVQRREVERPNACRRPPEPLGRRDVAPHRGADDRDGVGLPRHQVGRQYAEAAPAGPAACERDSDPRLATARILLVQEDRASLDATPREAQPNRVAARPRARCEPQPVRHLAAALTKVGEERNMLERHDRRNGFGDRKAGRSRFVGGRPTAPPSSSLHRQDASPHPPGVSPRVRESVWLLMIRLQRVVRRERESASQ